MPVPRRTRILALARGITAMNTVERFVRAGERSGLGSDEVRSWCDAFEYVQLLRLREEHRRGREARPETSNPIA